MPDEIDLACLKTNGGLQDGEEAMPEDPVAASAGPKVAALIPEPGIVNSLVEMGFALEGCKKAAFHTNNAGTLGIQIQWGSEIRAFEIRTF